MFVGTHTHNTIYVPETQLIFIAEIQLKEGDFNQSMVIRSNTISGSTLVVDEWN